MFGENVQPNVPCAKNFAELSIDTKDRERTVSTG